VREKETNYFEKRNPIVVCKYIYIYCIHDYIYVAVNRVSDILLPHVVRDTAGDHMHSVRADVDEAVERREPGRTAAVGREPEGQEARDTDGRGRGRHIRFLLVPDTGERAPPRSTIEMGSNRSKDRPKSTTCPRVAEKIENVYGGLKAPI